MFLFIFLFFHSLLYFPGFRLSVVLFCICCLRYNTKKEIKKRNTEMLLLLKHNPVYMIHLILLYAKLHIHKFKFSSKKIYIYVCLLGRKWSIIVIIYDFL